MPFRLLHTADLLLDVPFVGVGPTPRPMFERLRDAPLATLGHLVDAALARGVDAVLVAGGVSAGGATSPRAAARLADATERLAGAGIATIVALGPRDGTALPSVPGRDLPDAVTVVGPSEVAAVALERDGDRLVTVVAAGAPQGPGEAARAAREVGEGPLVALATLPPGPPPPLDTGAGVLFWALGGVPEPRGGAVAEGGWAVVAATPQPRAFPRPGPRPGAALLVVDEAGPRPPLPLDVADVRLASVEVDLARAPSVDELEAQALAQLAELGEAPGPDGSGPPGDRPVVAQLVAHGDGPGRRPLGDPATRRWVLERLRARLAEAPPGWWADVVLLPLPVAGHPAGRSPATAGGLDRIRANADRASRRDPAGILTAARRDGGAGPPDDPLPPPGAWPLLVHGAASLAADLIGASAGGEAR